MPEKVVATGKFRYGGQVYLPIRIVETSFFPGTGDYEDALEIREDQQGIFFEIQYSSTTAGIFNSSGGYFKTLEDAKKRVLILKMEVIWDS